MGEVANNILREIKKLADPVRAKHSVRYFKTAKGQYGEGDIFWGLRVPQIRALAKRYQASISTQEVVELLKNPVHEVRLMAVILLTHQAKERPKEIFDTYLKNTKYVNNWDLVDTSAKEIVGTYIDGRSKKILTTLAKSKDIWERRIAMVATWHSIKKGEHEDAFMVADMLVNDTHDLIHKAVGWMLREVGNYSGQAVEEEFLKKHAHYMPRTMLRYAIEKFPEKKRKEYLALKNRPITV